MKRRFLFGGNIFSMQAPVIRRTLEMMLWVRFDYQWVVPFCANLTDPTRGQTQEIANLEAFYHFENGQHAH
jgi:hypothetical protein